MRFSGTNRLGDQAAPVGSNASLKITTHDPGALRILQLLKDSPALTDTMTALTAAVLNSSRSNDTKALAALESLIDQTRKVSVQIGHVHCETQNGRSGQQLAIVSLRLGEQACDYLQAGLATSDPEKLKADLAQAATYARASESNGSRAIKLLSQ